MGLTKHGAGEILTEETPKTASTKEWTPQDEADLKKENADSDADDKRGC